MHDPFCSIDFGLLNWEQFYSLRSFNPACSQAPNVAIKMHTYRQLVDFSDPIYSSLYFIYQKRYFLFPQKKRIKKRKHSSDTRFRSRKQAGVFRKAHELICKRLPSIMYVFRDYSTFYISPLRKWTNVLGLKIQTKSWMFAVNVKVGV